ncbi:hypothetical protein P7C71_g4612, partial [Lecanoromycetidae sp. Uapishka_2]
MTLQQDRARLMSHFAGDTSKHPNKWSDLWDKGDFLPWDKGIPNPALVDVLSDRQDLLGSCIAEDAFGSKRRKRALVPGCGKGYDVLLLASFGYDAFGLEVSETAVKRCNEEQEIHGDKYPVKDKKFGAGNVTFMFGDFFGTDWMKNVEGDGKVDLIYDYTFLCALPPSFRPDWALRMSQLLAVDGNLICIEFPTTKDPKIGGPPHALPPPVYTEHLAHPGQGLAYDDDTGHIKEGVAGPNRPTALKRVAHWQPERTHAIGKDADGNVMDWVSVWRH